MSRIAKIYQIYYDDVSRAELDGQFIPYFNEAGSKYFESQVILDLHDRGEMQDCEYFGVVSYRIWQKASQVNTIEAMISADSMHHDYYYVGNPCNYTQVWKWPEMLMKCDLTSWTEVLLNRLGYRVNLRELNTPGSFYNYQICKSELYRQYVDEMLQPMIDLMNDTENQALQDWINTKVNYIRCKPPKKVYSQTFCAIIALFPAGTRDTLMRYTANIYAANRLIHNPAFAERLKSITGFPYYTKHTFIAEMLFPTYAAIKGWKGKQFG